MNCLLPPPSESSGETCKGFSAPGGGVLGLVVVEDVHEERWVLGLLREDKAPSVESGLLYCFSFRG